MKKFLFGIAVIVATIFGYRVIKQAPKFPQIIESIANSAGPAEKDDPRFIKGMHPTLIESGWKYFYTVDTFQEKTLFQRFKEFKPDAFLMWLPFGRTDGYDFDLADFQSTMNDPRLKNVANIPEFVSVMEALHHEIGDKPMYFYLGYVGGVSKYWSNLNGAEKLKQIEEALAPYAELQKRIGKQVHIIIDTMAIRCPGDINYEVLLPLLKKMGFGYGGEAWPMKCQIEAKTPNYQTVFTYPNLFMDPSVQANDWAMLRMDMKGPIFPWINDWLPNEDEHMAATRAAKLIKNYGHVIWSISWNQSFINADEIRTRLKELN